MEVPDATRFAMSPDAPFQEFSIEHINYFTPVSLVNLMGRYGFSEVFSEQASYDQTDTHIGYAARILFQRTEAAVNLRKIPAANRHCGNTSPHPRKWRTAFMRRFWS